MTDEQFQRIAHVLADPTRFAILQRLASADEVACQCLVGEFDVTAATISHHVKELSAAGLIDARRQGKCFHFSVRRDTVAAYQRELHRRLSPGEPAPKPPRPTRAPKKRGTPS